MRKKLLRSRSGFEKPESREEAIMQNILGASNVLEPSESNIEEILKSILYNTPYTKEAEFEIEKILLAIKNNGTYDGKGESRDMKILIAILNDLDYTEEPESRIEELFIEWLQQRQQIKVLEGVPPLTFPARGLPLINYLIEGNTVQNGTPTPDNPIMPQGTGERTGNLFDYKTAYAQYLSGDDILITPIQMTSERQYFKASEIGKTITISVFAKTVTSNRVFIRANVGGTNINSNTVSRGNSGTLTVTVTPTSTSDFFNLTYGDGGDYNTFNKFMLNLGSTALPYEPYGYKIPISSANTTTPIYLGEVETTRLVKKLVLTGAEENWIGHGAIRSWYQLMIDDVIIDKLELCTHYKPSTHSAGDIENGEILAIKQSASNSGRIIIKDTNCATKADFLAYLAAQYAAGTPVTVWYVLATEQTGIVNEPLRKIGNYADSISMEQTGIEIPTINGSNTFDVNTTVKPSNVYIEYK